MLQPITYLDGLGQVDVTGAGQRFCLAFNPLTSKFPFNPNATPEVTLTELADILRPGSGKLWTFYMQLMGRLQCQNGQCSPTGGNPPLSPVFVRYMSQMMQFSRALYGDTGADPHYKYTLKPQTSDQVMSFDVTVNGDVAKLAAGGQKQYEWPGPGSPNFNLTLHLAGGSVQEPENFSGQWAVFRFFADADRTTAAGGGYSFSFSVTTGRDRRPINMGGRPLTYDIQVDTGGGPAVFSKDFLSTLRCIGPFGR